MLKQLSMLACLLVTSFLLAPSVLAQIDDNQNNETLRGLKGVRFTIRPVSPDLERDGITRSKLQTDVEIKLRQAGIHVLTEEDWRRETSAGGGAWLELYVGAVKNNETGLFYAVSVNLKLMQPVHLLRNQALKTFATTWSTGSVGIFGMEKLPTIRQEVVDKVAEFINGFLIANPK